MKWLRATIKHLRTKSHDERTFVAGISALVVMLLLIMVWGLVTLG